MSAQRNRYAEAQSRDEDDVSVAGEEVTNDVCEDGVRRQRDDELLGDGDGLVKSRQRCHGRNEGERQQ